MDTAAATRLADQLNRQRHGVCGSVAARLLRAFPELTRTLRLEESYSPAARLSQVAVERLNELVRSVLLFDLPALADEELRWAHGVLPRKGVTLEHQSAMVRWFFEEVRRLQLSADELAVARETEQHLLASISQAYQAN